MLSLPVNKKRLCVCVCVYNELNVPTDKVHVERKEDEEREKMLGSTSQSSALWRLTSIVHHVQQQLALKSCELLARTHTHTHTMCCHFALYRQLLRICRPLETHGQKAFRVAHPPTLLAVDSATAKGHRMAFSRADGHPFSSLSLSLFPTPSTSYLLLDTLSFFPSRSSILFFFFFFLLWWCARERESKGTA